MSDTPLTDELLRKQKTLERGDFYNQMNSHARSMEQQLKEANTLLDECKRLFIGINDTCIDIVHGSASGIDAEKLSPRLKQMITKIQNRNKS